MIWLFWDLYSELYGERLLKTSQVRIGTSING